MLENIRLAFQGVWSHKLRSMLTMLGIIIGIASIISIVSTIQGTNEQIKQNLIGGGNNTVDIELYRADEKIQVSDYEQAPSGVPTITVHRSQQRSQRFPNIRLTLMAIIMAETAIRMLPAILLLPILRILMI